MGEKSTLSEIWAQAEVEFPAADQYGIAVERHDAGFYLGQITRNFGDDESGRVFRIISHEQAEDPATALSRAVRSARGGLIAGFDWLREPLPTAQAEAA
jgi:hypothetical protein